MDERSEEPTRPLPDVADSERLPEPAGREPDGREPDGREQADPWATSTPFSAPPVPMPPIPTQHRPAQPAGPFPPAGPAPQMYPTGPAPIGGPGSGYPMGSPTTGYPTMPAPPPGYPTGAPVTGPVAGYPTSAPVSGYPTGAPVTGPVAGYQPGPGPVMVQIGEIAVTSTMVRTPAGDLPLAGSQWNVQDYWQSEQKIPQWAIICAILGFCVLTVFSLLFLLARETIQHGTVQITVTSGNRQYVARIPVGSQQQVHHIHQQVNYVRSLAAI